MHVGYQGTALHIDWLQKEAVTDECCVWTVNLRQQSNQASSKSNWDVGKIEKDGERIGSFSFAVNIMYQL